MNVVDFLCSKEHDLLPFPSHWPQYLGQAMLDLPMCWSIEANNDTHSQKVHGHLFSALVRSQQTSIFLERAITQNNAELWKKELRDHYKK